MNSTLWQSILKALCNLKYSILIASTLTIFGCGVDAGNPDSSGGKKSMINFLLTDAPVDDLEQFLVYAETMSFTSDRPYEIDLALEGEAVDLLQYQNGKTIQLIESVAINPGSIESFAMSLRDDGYPIRALYKESAQSESAFASVAVIDSLGQLSDQLEFVGNGEIAAGETKDFIVDVDLRRSLNTLTETDRRRLGLDETYQFSIQKQHSFYDQTAIGSLSVTGLAADSIVCLAPIDGKQPPESCLAEGFKPAKSNEQGDLSILVIKPGSYSLWLDSNGSYTLIQENIDIIANDISSIEF